MGTYANGEWALKHATNENGSWAILLLKQMIKIMPIINMVGKIILHIAIHSNDNVHIAFKDGGIK